MALRLEAVHGPEIPPGSGTGTQSRDLQTITSQSRQKYEMFARCYEIMRCANGGCDEDEARWDEDEARWDVAAVQKLHFILFCARFDAENVVVVLNLTCGCWERRKLSEEATCEIPF